VLNKNNEAIRISGTVEVEGRGQGTRFRTHAHASRNCDTRSRKVGALAMPRNLKYHVVHTPKP
jgi:hypothetical protein